MHLPILFLPNARLLHAAVSNVYIVLNYKNALVIYCWRDHHSVFLMFLFLLNNWNNTVLLSHSLISVFCTINWERNIYVCISPFPLALRPFRMQVLGNLLRCIFVRNVWMYAFYSNANNLQHLEYVRTHGSYFRSYLTVWRLTVRMALVSLSETQVGTGPTTVAQSVTLWLTKLWVWLCQRELYMNLGIISLKLPRLHRELFSSKFWVLRNLWKNKSKNGSLV